MVRDPAYLHCWNDDDNWNVKSCAAFVVSQLRFATGAPTVKRVVVPPEPNAVASDIVSRNFVPVANGNCGEYEPIPLLKADGGTDIFRAGAYTWEA